MTVRLFRERIGKKQLQGKSCSAMDESGVLKFTSVEKLLEAGRKMELSGSELEEFVAEQEEFESEQRQRKLEHEHAVD